MDNNNKLICPVKRIETQKTPSVDLKINVDDNTMNFNVNFTIKNIIKSAIDFIMKKFSN